MTTKQSIFMTGGSGFVGQHVAAALSAHGHEVMASDVRLDDLATLEKQMSSKKWDFVLHFAAVSSFAFCEKNPEIVRETNVVGTSNICKLLMKHAPHARLIFASTGQVYEISDMALTEESQVSPRTVYANSKVQSEHDIQEFTSRGLKATVLRIFNHTHCSQSSTFFLPGIFDQLTKAKDQQVTLKVGNLNIERDLGAISDLTRALVALVESTASFANFELFNLCSGHARSLIKLVQLMAARMAVKATIEVDPARYRDEAKRLVGSYRKLQAATGWSPSSASDEQFIESFLAPDPAAESPRQNSAGFGVIPSSQGKENRGPVKRIPVANPVLNGNEKQYVNDCLDTAWISSNGKYIARFESEFSERMKSKHALTCCNGTVALHLALLALDIGPGDEVIVPSLTYIATANAVSYVGAKLVLCDVEEKTWCVTAENLKSKISPKTKAIMVVHLYGHPVDMDPIMKLANEHKIPVIEDCAESLGATYKGQMTGTIGAIGTFSFFGNKTITTGEGGMITTQSKELAEKMRLLKGQGMDPNRRYWHPIVGYNYRMTNIEAAIGCAQLEKLDWHLAQRRRVAATYQKHLEGAKGLELPSEASWAYHTYWMYTVRVKGADASRRDRIMQELDRCGIETRPIFYCMHLMPPHKSEEKFPISEAISASGINLPTFATLTEEEIAYVCQQLKQVVQATH